MDEFSKIAVGCAIVFAIATILVVAVAAAQPMTQGTSTPVGNLITQNTVKYGNSTTYMMEWNGSSGIMDAIAGGAGGTTIYSGRVSSGTQITIVVANGESATVFLDNRFVTEITP